MTGSKCESVSRVSVIVACPSISLTTLGWTPCERSSAAAVCRRSWKRICGRSVVFSATYKGWHCQLGPSGESISLQKMSPWSLDCSRAPYGTGGM
jgi:hypothetical protein